MFKFLQYTVRFKHVYDPAIEEFANSYSKSTLRRMVEGHAILPYKGKTICWINNENGETIASGAALLSWKDTFNRQYALEKSFGRALARLFPLPDDAASKPNAKQVRRDAWVQFAKHHQKPMGELTLLAKMEDA